MKVNQLKLGAFLSYVNIFFLNAINLVFTPYMLRVLGQGEYGLYSLIGSFVGYLLVLDFGLNNTIVRYVAKFRAEKKRKEEENFLGMSIVIYSVLAVCVVIIGVILFCNLKVFFGNSLSSVEFQKARSMFIILVINIVITLPLNAFPAIMTGYEVFVFPKILTILRVILRTAILFILLNLGCGAVEIVILDTLLNIAFMAANVVYVFWKLKVRIRLYSFDKPLLIEVFSFSFFVFLNLIVDQVYWRIGQLILGVVANTAAVAIFAVGMQLSNYYMQLSTAISGVFLPKATQMVVKNASSEEMNDLMIKTGRIQFVILGFVLYGFLLFGKQFIVLWAGSNYISAWSIAVCVMVPLTVPLFQNVGLSILQAKNKHAFRSIMYLIIAVANVIVSFIASRRFGPVGAALGTSFSLIIGNIVIINLYYHFVIGLNIKRFFKELLNKISIAMILIVLVGYFINMIPGSGWINLVLKCIIYAIDYAFFMYLIGFNDYEKKLICSPVAVILGKLGLKKIQRNEVVS